MLTLLFQLEHLSVSSHAALTHRLSLHRQSTTMQVIRPRYNDRIGGVKLWALSLYQDPNVRSHLQTSVQGTITRIRNYPHKLISLPSVATKQISKGAGVRSQDYPPQSGEDEIQAFRSAVDASRTLP